MLKLDSGQQGEISLAAYASLRWHEGAPPQCAPSSGRLERKVKRVKQSNNLWSTSHNPPFFELHTTQQTTPHSAMRVLTQSTGLWSQTAPLRQGPQGERRQGAEGTRCQEWNGEDIHLVYLKIILKINKLEQCSHGILYKMHLSIVWLICKLSETFLLWRRQRLSWLPGWRSPILLTERMRRPVVLGFVWIEAPSVVAHL